MLSGTTIYNNKHLNKNYPWYVLALVMLGTLMATLDTSIVNISVPAIMADFGSSIDDIEWIMTGYMLAFATLMPLTGWLHDKIGYKNLYIASLILFTIGSLLCGLAWNLPSLIFARIIQALGGGAITPVGMAMISEVFEPKDRAKALGLWGLGVILGPAFGPTLGGWLTMNFGWRSIFMVNLPIGIAGVLLSLSFLRPDRILNKKSPLFDIWGFLFLSLFMIMFLLGLSRGDHDGWTSTFILSCFSLCIIGLIGFCVAVNTVKNGILDLSILKFPSILACLVISIIRSIALFGTIFLLPLFMLQLRGYDEVQSGLILLPGALIIGVTMAFTGKLMEITSPRLLTIVGLLCVGWFLFSLRTIDANTSTLDIIFATLVRGLGIGFLFTPVMATALNAVPEEKSNAISVLLNIAQQIGGAVGIAVLSTVLSHRFKFHLSTFSSNMDSLSPEISGSLERVHAHAHMLGYNHTDSAAIAIIKVSDALQKTASTAAFQDTFLVAAVIMIFGFIFAYTLPSTPQGKTKNKVQEL